MKSSTALVLAGGGLAAYALLGNKKPSTRPTTPATGSGPPNPEGVALAGLPDYVLVYIGQLAKGYKAYGIGSYGTPIIPATPRAYAGAVLEWWAGEITRLRGAAMAPTHWNTPAYSLPALATANRLVSEESSEALAKGWNKLQPLLVQSLGTTTSSGLKGFLPPDDARVFWYNISKLSIVVDVDRAVPSMDGQAWIALAQSTRELPQTIQGALSYAANGAKDLLSGAIWAMLKPFVPVLAAGGAIWYLSRKRRSYP